MGLWNALTSAHETEKPKCRVVIVGAGPAGLLTAINFLRREGPVQYTVDLVETGEDFGALDAAGLEKKRSWMIGEPQPQPQRQPSPYFTLPDLAIL